MKMSLDLGTAERIGKAAIARAEELGIKVSVAVVNESGILAYLARMDGTGFLTPDTAYGKAYVSAAFKKSSALIAQSAEARPAFQLSVSARTGGKTIIGQGGLPIILGGEVVGAVGAGGGTGEQDEEVVKAGIAAVA